MSLVYTFSDLRTEAAFKVGWGTDADVWTSNQIERLGAMVNSGYRFFLFPPTAGEGGPHTWSWLIHGGDDPTTIPGGGASAFSYAAEQVAQLTLSMGIDEYILPVDFGGIVGELTYRPVEPGGGGYGVASQMEHDKRLTLINDTEMRTMQGNATQIWENNSDQGNGPPQYASYRLGRFDTTTGVQPYRLTVFPKPDNAYQMLFQYFSMPQDLLSETNTNPLCPPQHAELLKAAVLGAAELMMDDRRGEYWDRFLALLQQGIAHDRLILGRTGEAYPIEGLVNTMDQDWMSIAIQMGLRHGFPPNPRSWTNTQQQRVFYDLKSAYGQILVAHNWKFLKPLQLIRLEGGKNRYDLPKDFDGVIGELTFMSADHLASAYE